jgi:hypothetical protein
MRTTVTLDSDVEALLRKRMRDGGVSFKQALNEALRQGLTEARPPRRFRTPTAKLGMPTVNLDRALQLAAELEDEELVRKMRAGK